jgi:hypothetical protein
MDYFVHRTANYQNVIIGANKSERFFQKKKNETKGHGSLLHVVGKCVRKNYDLAASGAKE